MLISLTTLDELTYCRGWNIVLRSDKTWKLTVFTGYFYTQEGAFVSAPGLVGHM